MHWRKIHGIILYPTATSLLSKTTIILLFTLGCITGYSLTNLKLMYNKLCVFKIFKKEKMCKGPSIKDVCTKSRKIDPLDGKMSALAQPPLTVRTHHKFRKIRSFLHQKVRTSASEDPLPPCPQNVHTRHNSPGCGRLLWTAPNCIVRWNLVFKYLVSVSLNNSFSAGR